MTSGPRAVQVEASRPQSVSLLPQMPLSIEQGTEKSPRRWVQGWEGEDSPRKTSGPSEPEQTPYHFPQPVLLIYLVTPGSRDVKEMAELGTAQSRWE